MVIGLRLEAFDEDGPDVEEPFRSTIRHLMLLANQARRVISNAHIPWAVARYLHAPKESALQGSIAHCNE